MLTQSNTQGQSRPNEEGTSSTGGSSRVVRSYPRKRVAIACDVCRLRKTRCDAAKPSCSFCTELGIECHYQGPSAEDRRTTAEIDYDRALKRLEDIQSTLDAVAAAVGAGQHNIGFDTSPATLLSGHSSTSPASLSISSRTRAVPRMPNLFVFRALRPINVDRWSYDCTENFFRLQMTVEQDLCSAIKSSNGRIDLSRPHLWRLQRSFVENVLKWLPLFDHETAIQYFKDASFTNPDEDDPTACLSLLMYAAGALAADTSLYNMLPEHLPGFDYYARAVRSLRHLPRSGEDLCILQCYALASMYLLLAMRPLEAWKTIRQASQTCVFLLKARLTENSPNFKELFNRIYWICYVLESELEISLELPASGLRSYEDTVPLPTSHYEEEGMYNLLALASLRRLMVEVVDAAGLRSPTTITYAPAVTLELRNQIDHWYQHLPQNLHFPSDQTLLFDMRKAYLRCMYFVLIAVVFWPFVPRCKDIIHEDSFSLVSEQSSMDEQSMQIMQGAEECLEASRNYLRVAEEVLTQKTLVSHMIIRSYFATAMILLLVLPVQPAHSDDTGDAALILQAIHNLAHWNLVPFMQQPLDEMRRIARLKGLNVQELLE